MSKWYNKGNIYFNPRPREGGDGSDRCSRCGPRGFQSTPPRGGRQRRPVCDQLLGAFQSTPPRGGRRSGGRWRSCWPRFQSTPPAKGATIIADINTFHNLTFQSTPPAKGATKIQCGASKAIRYFNPRPPRRGRLIADINTFHNLTFQSTPPAKGATKADRAYTDAAIISIHAPHEGGDSKDAQFYLRIFDKQVELLRFLGIIRGGCLRNPEKDRRFLGKSLANLPAISGHLDFAGGGKARPGYPCAVPLPRRAACVRGSGDPPADRCSSYRNAPLFSHIASPDSKSADCLSQNP